MPLPLGDLFPYGLAGIEEHLPRCRMDLVPHTSGFNGRTILRSADGENRFEFAMDASTGDILIASGEMYLPEEESWQLLQSLGEVLREAGFPHLLGVDNFTGERTRWVEHQWSARLQ